MENDSKGALLSLSTTTDIPEQKEKSAHTRFEPSSVPMKSVTDSRTSYTSRPRDLHVWLFGDQTAASDLQAHIKDLYQQSSHSRSLQTFLQNATDALQGSIVELNHDERKHFPDFHTILDLAHQSVARDVITSTVLFCIAQLGSLIIKADNDPFLLIPSEARRCILGICTGFIPAAAALASQSVRQLVDIGPDMVCIALRIGFEAYKRSQQIEPGTSSWAFVVVGLSAIELQAIIDDFHQCNSLPTYMSLYISAYSEGSSTLSGPPAILHSLVAFSKIFANASKLELPIAAAFHAPHLQRPDYRKIIGSSAVLDLPLTGNLELISTSTNVSFDNKDANNVGELLIQGLEDIFQSPLNWSKAAQGIIKSSIRSEGDLKGKVFLTSFGPNALVKSFLKLAAMEGAEVIMTKSPSTETHTAEISPKFRGGSGDIAVIGMAGRFPGANDLQEFWEILKNARDLHKEIPKDRFDIKTHYDSSGMMPNTTITPFGCFIEKPGLFDSRLFRMSPREAKQTDPTQRLLLLSTYEALEMAGYARDESGLLSIPPSMRGERFATFFGQTTDDWRECNAGQDIDNFYVPGGMRAFGPGRLNYWFKWEGASYSIDTACSSSSAAVEMACASLLARKCDTAVAGGGNILTGPSMFSGLSRGGFLSPTGNCKTFSDEADGYCRGDAVGVVILKRLEDAIADNDNIQGVIRSVSTNHSAHAVSITHPHAPTQQKLYETVLQNANIEPSTIQYVEMHGTGTQAGDAAEMLSVSTVLGNDRLPTNPLYVGSVKANMGHSEAAAGITSLIKSMLMFRKGEIPPHPMTGELNRNFSLQGKNILIPSTHTRFGRDTVEPKRILLNNFNATGGNTVLLLEEPPRHLASGEDPRSHYVVTVSASTPLSLRQNKERMLQYIQSNPVEVKDLAYTTTARRMHHGFRDAFTIASTAELIEVLVKDLQQTSEPIKLNEKPSIVFVFTGQGSHFKGMGEHLYSTCSSFRENILEFQSICTKLGFPPFADVITNSSLNFSLVSTVEIQLATVSLELAIARLYMSWGVNPNLVIGHSLGEYPAMHIAGVLSLADMFYLVGKRAELVLEKCSADTHSMLAIKASLKYVREILEDAKFASCNISCCNSIASIVVSGPVHAIKQLQIRLVDIGTNSVIIDLPYAFHSPHVDPILIPFRKFAEQVRFAEPSIPIASSLLGKAVKNQGVFSADYLLRHAIEKVNFAGALQNCESSGLTNKQTIWIENGPGSSSISMIRATVPSGLTLPSLKHAEPTWKTISKALASIYSKGCSVDWPEYHKQYKNALRLLELPTYAFDLKDYWIQYEGTWALTKNRQPAIAPPPPAFSTTTLHRIETESFSENEATATFVSDLKEEKLLLAIRGHLVNKSALCPSSVYSDMAFTAAAYLHSKQNPSTQLPSLDLTLMEVFHPLVVAEDDESHQIIVTASIPIDSQSVHITFSSKQGFSDAQDHGHCTVVFGDGRKWMDIWSRYSYLISERRDNLFNLATSHPTHRILGSLVYKLFSTLVNYSTEYRCLTEVFMNDVLNEAAATLQFKPSPAGTVFTYSPYWIDSIVHLAGFVLNGHITTAQDDVYISHGWESLRIAKPLCESHGYTSYVRMQPVGTKGVFVGDVFIFDGGQIIATCSGLKFQKMKKDVLQTLLGAPKLTNISVQSAFSYWPNLESISKPEYWAPDSRPRFPQKKELIDPLAFTNTDDSFSAVLKVIADEIGIGPADLFDSTRFDELGVDSLLTISITTKLRIHTNFDLPTSVFSSYPTVAQLRSYLETRNQELQGSQRSTRAASINSSAIEKDGTISPATTELSLEGFDIITTFISAVAEETGLESYDLKDADNFEDLGIDSIMSIAILGSLRNRTGTVLPTSIFKTYPTLGHFKDAFGKSAKPTVPSQASPSTKSFHTELSSNSVLLQGKPNCGLPTLFLIADGAGSAASYINIPEFTPKLPVYALESPFLHNPTEFTCSIQEVSQIYVSKLRSIQPHGPYFIGGWSLGGIYAYEVAHQLTTKFNEEVRGVLMIDSPCPRPIEMPEPTMELMEETGLFIGIKRAGKAETPMPLSQKQHLLSCVKALRVYDPAPISEGKRPRDVVMIWAKNGLFEKLGAKIKEVAEDQTSGSGDGDSVGLKKDWLTAERTSFGPNGWDRLLGDGIECHAIEGDHFSIMNLPRIKNTGELMQVALDKFLAV